MEVVLIDLLVDAGFTNLLLTSSWGWTYEKEVAGGNVAYQVLIAIPSKFFYSLVWYYDHILVMILLARSVRQLLLKFHIGQYLGT